MVICTKEQVTQQKYYNMQTFNKPFSVIDKVLKKNMANESYLAMIKMKEAIPYTVIQVSAVRDINSKTNMNIL